MAKQKKQTADNDNISALLGGKIPDVYKDKDDFLDIVHWNLRWFNEYNTDKVNNIYSVLAALNADVFVFEEIKEGSLDKMAERLRESKKGSYEVVYGKTGGDQRIAIMYDLEWIRSKDEISELFGKNTVLTTSGKDVFPRLPLWGYFYCRTTDIQRGVDFQLVGLHLKSQMDKAGDGDDEIQRTLAANKLVDWMEKEAENIDRDIILCGDWNKIPSDKCWDAFRKMEKKDKIHFTDINDESQYSHLYYKNRKDWGSRLDLAVVSSNDINGVKLTGKDQPLLWLSLEKLIENDATTAKELKEIINKIKTEVTDHLPVHLRFYIRDKGK